MSSSFNPTSRSPRVAVIAVHGVGHHDPTAPANAMVELLPSLHLDSSIASPYYEAFLARSLNIPLAPVSAPRDPPIAYFFRRLVFCRSEAPILRRIYGGRLLKAPEAGRVGSEFMSLLLRDYLGGAAGDTYNTTRLEGARFAEAPGDRAIVHVYEVFWADLARPENTLLSFFFALFQMLFRLGSLSCLVIDSASGENPGRLWRVFRAIQEYAVRMLQVPIPLLNLVLCIVAMSVLPGHVAGEHPILGVLLLGAAIGVGSGFLASRVTS
jgi:hypothetical protein